MKYFALLLSFSLVHLFAAAEAAAESNYPPTKTVDVSDTYFGVTYKDPYRWLEDLKNKEVETWFKAQAELTENTLAKIPGRNALAEEWMALDKLRAVSYRGVVVHNGRVFYKKTLGGENVGKLFYRNGIKGEEKLLFDPTDYAKGVATVVQSFMPSWDGKYVVLGLSTGGAEWSDLRVISVESGQLLSEVIKTSWEPYGWTPDGKSFFYDAGKITDVRSLDIQLNRKTALHKIGSPVSDDQDFFSNESYPALAIEPKESPTAEINPFNPNFVFGHVETVQAESKIYYAPTSQVASRKLQWKQVCNLSDNIVGRGFVVDTKYLYGVTHTGAPHYKVVRTPIENPDWRHAEVVFPEATDSVQTITRSKSYLYVVYSNGITGRIQKYELATGKISELQLPVAGNVSISCPDVTSDWCQVYISSWTRPPAIYDYDAKAETWNDSQFYVKVNYPGFEDVISEEVEAPSHDGVMVPLSIIHKKGLTLDGSNCCILEGYGAYGNSITPHFNIQFSVANRGVVIAIAHPRGGSEKGDSWYKAGFKTTKHNTWKDFIACGEYLVKKGYTSPARLTGTGTSAGGILISRAITDRPDLFRAAICNVGCANAMRMEFSPNGPSNIPEFGTVTDETECKALYEMDGLAHVKPGVKYPAVLGVTGWNDPRVSPWEPGKFVAALQNTGASDRPVMLKVNFDNGHFTEEKTVTYSNFAAQTAFLLWQAGHADFQSK